MSQRQAEPPRCPGDMVLKDAPTAVKAGDEHDSLGIFFLYVTKQLLEIVSRHGGETLWGKQWEGWGEFPVDMALHPAGESIRSPRKDLFSLGNA